MGGRRTMCVDGANLMFYLCTGAPHDEARFERFRGAGQPEVLARGARNWAAEMHRAGFDLLIVYDGSDPDAKLRTAFRRTQNRFARNVAASVAMASGRTPNDITSHVPTGAGTTVIEALRRCPNVGLYRDVVEADAMLAACARTFESAGSVLSAELGDVRSRAAPGPAPPSAPVHAVLGNDSDFLIFGCRYIELSCGHGASFELHRLSPRRTAIDAVVWEPDELHATLGLSTSQEGRWEAALFATLVGNDYADRECSALRKLHTKLGGALPMHSARVVGLRTVATGGTMVTLEPPLGVDTGRHRTLATYTNKMTAADGEVSAERRPSAFRANPSHHLTRSPPYIWSFDTERRRIERRGARRTRLLCHRSRPRARSLPRAAQCASRRL